MKKTAQLFGFVAAFGITGLYAQDVSTQSHNVAISIPVIAILDIESTAGENVSFALNADGLEAGAEFIIDEENSDLWINYTSIVPAVASARTITVHSDNAPTITGLTLKVVASAHTGVGGGNFGTPTAIVTPSAIPTDIITGIGSAFTGNGNSNGHNLTYHLDFNGDFADLNVASAFMTINMTYTITD